MDRFTASPLPGWLDAPVGWTGLDPTSDRLQRLVTGLPLGPVRDVLHGAWLGHPLHPALAQLPIGCWLSAAALDLTCTSPPAARRLTALGLAAVPPTLWAGWVDWSELSAERRRTGLVHAASAVTATVLQIGSYRARRHGRTRSGILLGLAGTAVVSLTAAFGGHLAHRQADTPASPEVRVADDGEQVS
ncbi:putative membrane protein [Kitasatospora gansuensis]|uniref:Putative membrane protein n=1 Tax=Kitasatospora gansuensis TaxID=258050 RepID=A0A7W7SJK9_9ACTN|nr:DUF2231 domain-containing protein [Kitasatospora gansuensis]MBB4951679.1 putative membrane protein [Kitasatospora gansuensis]